MIIRGNYIKVYCFIIQDCTKIIVIGLMGQGGGEWNSRKHEVEASGYSLQIIRGVC